MTIKVLREKISKEELIQIVEQSFGTVAKAAVDIDKEILAIGGEFHAETQELLVAKEGSSAQDIWGINFHPFNPPAERIEYIALINIKPNLGHREMLIRDKTIRIKIKNIVNRLLLDDNETLTPQN